jgi:hypothetical protein
LVARLVRVEEGAEVPPQDMIYELGCVAIGWVRVFGVDRPDERPPRRA